MDPGTTLPCRVLPQGCLLSLCVCVRTCLTSFVLRVFSTQQREGEAFFEEDFSVSSPLPPPVFFVFFRFYKLLFVCSLSRKRMKVYGLIFAAAAAAAGTASAQIEENVFAAACDNKAVGATCTYSLPDGSEKSGVCFSPNSPSACGPGYDATSTCIMCGESDPTAGTGSGGGGPAKENASTAACDNKDVGDACAFVSPDGAKNTGVCEDEGAGACGPIEPGATEASACYVCNIDTAPPNADSGATGGDVNSNNECSGANIGDSCQIVRGDNVIDGICSNTEENIDTGDGKLSCSPAADYKATTTGPDDPSDGGDELSTVLQDACTGLSADATCSYTDDMTGKKVSGTCVSGGGRGSVLQCDNTDTGTDTGSGANTDPSTDPLVIACSSKSAGASCTANFGIADVTGACQLSEDGADLFCSPVGGQASRYLRAE